MKNSRILIAAIAFLMAVGGIFASKASSSVGDPPLYRKSNNICIKVECTKVFKPGAAQCTLGVPYFETEANCISSVNPITVPAYTRVDL